MGVTAGGLHRLRLRVIRRAAGVVVPMLSLAAAMSPAAGRTAAAAAGEFLAGDEFLERLLAIETQCDAICTPPDAAAMVGGEIRAAAAGRPGEPAAGLGNA